MSEIDASYYVRPAKVKDRTSAGGVVVRRENDTGRLLIALAHEQGLKSYVLPKGGIEAGESLEDTARREIQEEAGFAHLTRVAALGSRSRLSFDRRRWITTHYFLFETDEIEVTPTDPKHNFVADWFPLDDLPPLFWPEQQELVETSRPLIKQALDAALQDGAERDNVS